ncbi:unnamed protein product [Protopolystoma xenopodis]|uniref:Uncharacterized protein n=1 Tax=Protopolystoma xenopodis TaxID=117903 RepID=A0A3S5A533_9PLAT|nr:unnamed protein product [Protopolystoma xenopodis]
MIDTKRNWHDPRCFFTQSDICRLPIKSPLREWVLSTDIRPSRRDITRSINNGTIGGESGHTTSSARTGHARLGVRKWEKEAMKSCGEGPPPAESQNSLPKAALKRRSPTAVGSSTSCPRSPSCVDGCSTSMGTSLVTAGRLAKAPELTGEMAIRGPGQIGSVEASNGLEAGPAMTSRRAEWHQRRTSIGTMVVSNIGPQRRQAQTRELESAEVQTTVRPSCRPGRQHSLAAFDTVARSGEACRRRESTSRGLPALQKARMESRKAFASPLNRGPRACERGHKSPLPALPEPISVAWLYPCQGPQTAASRKQAKRRAFRPGSCPSLWHAVVMDDEETDDEDRMGAKTGTRKNNSSLESTHRQLFGGQRRRNGENVNICRDAGYSDNSDDVSPKSSKASGGSPSSYQLISGDEFAISSEPSIGSASESASPSMISKMRQSTQCGSDQMCIDYEYTSPNAEEVSWRRLLPF